MKYEIKFLFLGQIFLVCLFTVIRTTRITLSSILLVPYLTLFDSLKLSSGGKWCKNAVYCIVLMRRAVLMRIAKK